MKGGGMGEETSGRQVSRFVPSTATQADTLARRRIPLPGNSCGSGSGGLPTQVEGRKQASKKALHTSKPTSSLLCLSTSHLSVYLPMRSNLVSPLTHHIAPAHLTPDDQSSTRGMDGETGKRLPAPRPIAIYSDDTAVPPKCPTPAQPDRQTQIRSAVRVRVRESEPRQREKEWTGTHDRRADDRQRGAQQAMKRERSDAAAGQARMDRAENVYASRTRGAVFQAGVRACERAW
ncbi:uncharacterized protein K452DRAFT_354603 [Aplosporella prunicola CBS 121167]|uniref:Uncharacterized protein n=1 Tax=Aplosporella prunicola CBS 121167 TaxID=1176127 RepID=A0A6A6BSS8_9PEZI|nr:uncharacterized protein K452DRAFT_354603 [Aplosporella prunicola CBS 121167]KAF2147146.1 hypothetical protein K452DRAFT_354603 [Aplosporella prunicola CBS 121167]